MEFGEVTLNDRIKDKLEKTPMQSNVKVGILKCSGTIARNESLI